MSNFGPDVKELADMREHLETLSDKANWHHTKQQFHRREGDKTNQQALSLKSEITKIEQVILKRLTNGDPI